jgi:hypothetical protein
VKSPWEARVGILIDPRFHTRFVWTYKPYDSAVYGGQPRIDWHAADMLGRYWMIEVKSLADNRKSINLLTDVSSGQALALDALAKTVHGVALLAVGQGKTLYIFDWETVRCRRVVSSSKPHLLSMEESLLSYTWSPKNFREWNLWEDFLVLRSGRLLASPVPPVIPVPGSLVGSLGIGTGGTLTIFKKHLLETLVPPSPSISKRPVSRRTMRKRLLSGPLLSKPPE